MSHYDNHIDDFGPQLPESYEPGNYSGRRQTSQQRAYPAEDAGIPLAEQNLTKPRIRRGGTTAGRTEKRQTEPRPARSAKAKPSPKSEPKQKTTEYDTDLTTSGFVRFFTDHRTHKFFGLLLVAVALFLAVVTVSHLRSGAADQSMVINATVGEMAASGSTSNLGGPVGAKISHTIVTQWFGLGVIPFIAYFAVIGLSLLGVRKCRFWSATFQALLIGITTSVVLGLVSTNWPTTFAWGGMHGQYVNEYLRLYTGDLGAVGVSVLLIGAVFCVYLNYVSAFVKSRRAVYNARKERRRIAKLELERQRAEAEAELARAHSDMAEDISDEIIAIDPADKRETEFDIDSEDECISLDDIEDADSLESITPDYNLSAETDECTNTSQDLGFAVDDIDSSDEANITEQPAESIPSQPKDLPVADENPTCDIMDNDTEDENTDLYNPTPEDPVMETHLPEETLYQPDDDEYADDQNPEDAELDIEANEIEEATETEQPLYDPTAELSRYVKPPVDLLIESKDTGLNVDIEELEENKQRIIRTLLEYGIPIADIKATVGPTITLFEIVPAEGVRIASIRRLEDDIARSLAAEGIRIVAPIPGRGTVGIEVPNHVKHTVSMRSVLTSKAYQDSKMGLPMALGTTISNEVFIVDLKKMPHLLVAGATGQGKSVGLNAIIASLIYKRHPAELKFVLVDPKMVEFSLYSKLERHFLAKIEGEEDAIVTDPEKVKATLNSLCLEMDNRYRLLKDAYVRSLEEYNDKFINHRLNPEKGHRYMPYIVVVVDELADLIMMAGKEVEMPIARIAQKARAVGIHLIIATQRPSTNVITGMIKANFPARMAFRVAQMVDSKTILDRPGANSLIGKGDMLFSINSIVDRVQCAFISTEEVTSICDWISEQPGYDSAYYLPEYEPDTPDTTGVSGDRDSLFEECATFVVTSGTSSTSSLQRKFGIGYNRAGKIMDQLEASHIVGPANGGKPRAILVDAIGLERILECN